MKNDIEIGEREIEGDALRWKKKEGRVMMERSGMEESKGTKGRGCLDVADKRSR